MRLLRSASGTGGDPARHAPRRRWGCRMGKGIRWRWPDARIDNSALAGLLFDQRGCQRHRQAVFGQAFGGDDVAARAGHKGMSQAGCERPSMSTWQAPHWLRRSRIVSPSGQFIAQHRRSWRRGLRRCAVVAPAVDLERRPYWSAFAPDISRARPLSMSCAGSDRNSSTPITMGARPYFAHSALTSRARRCA